MLATKTLVIKGKPTALTGMMQVVKIQALRRIPETNPHRETFFLLLFYMNRMRI
jgi:hypothetical protein